VTSAAGTSRARGPYQKSARVQADIVDKAIAAFTVSGFTGTSMREIAMAVGMTQQGLRHHFPSKESLLEAVLRHRDDTSVEHYASLGLSAVDTLRAVIQDNLGRPGLVRMTAVLAAEATNEEHPAHQFFQEHFAAAREIFARLIRRGQKTGEFRDDLPASDLAVVLLALFEGLQIQWLTDSSFDLAKSFESALRVLHPPSAATRKPRTTRG
jgi:AcrR family transcriptional regulator